MMEVTDSAPTTPAQPNYSVPWTLFDTWLGIGIMIVVLVGVAVAAFFIPPKLLTSGLALVLLEPIFIIPVVLILGWKHISWTYLGFKSFQWKSLAIGCGVLVIAYFIILIHNLILMAFNVQTQGDTIAKLLDKLDSPTLFFLAAAVLAPLVEETFFRGFLFSGFRQSYGWVKAMLLSSAIFAIAHFELAALIPTFILGCVLAYVFHRSNSVWPGMILHFLVNGFAIFWILVATQFNLLN
ncbi:MAG TPA: type II CAAX endopeptidase family protein [Anaerolineales bacterium]|nr:type II CAAX endopeptidase family protein [Anaerolineales bacterium]